MVGVTSTGARYYNHAACSADLAAVAACTGLWPLRLVVQHVTGLGRFIQLRICPLLRGHVPSQHTLSTQCPLRTSGGMIKEVV